MPEPSKGVGPTDIENQLAGQAGRKNYLLAIAIDKYEHLPRLYNAVRDAESFAALLQDKYQFDPQHTTLLRDQEATRRNIYQSLDRLVQTVTPQDNLVLYFSGHGEFREQMDEGYWIPVDADRDAYFDFIPNQQIQHYLKRINSHHSFVVVDSCFSGALFTNRNLEPTERLETVPSRWLLTSGRKELVSDGKPGDHSPFAENVLLFLKQNQQPSLPISRLIDDVVHATAANARQTPRGEPIQDTGHKGGQFVFHLKRNEAADWAAAQRENTPEAYTRFLALYPEGQYHRQARAILEKEAEEAAWQAALKANSMQGYLSFEKNFPRSPYARDVRDKVANLEEEKLWENALRSDTITGYWKYLDRSQLKKYDSEALDAIKRLSESEEDIIRRKEAEARESQRRRMETAARLKEQERREAKIPVEQQIDLIEIHREISRRKRKRLRITLFSTLGVILVVLGILIISTLSKNRQMDTQKEVLKNELNDKAKGMRDGVKAARDSLGTIQEEDISKISNSLFEQYYQIQDGLKDALSNFQDDSTRLAGQIRKLKDTTEIDQWRTDMTGVYEQNFLELGKLMRNIGDLKIEAGNLLVKEAKKQADKSAKRMAYLREMAEGMCYEKTDSIRAFISDVKRLGFTQGEKEQLINKFELLRTMLVARYNGSKKPGRAFSDVNTNRKILGDIKQKRSHELTPVQLAWLEAVLKEKWSADQ